MLHTLLLLLALSSSSLGENTVMLSSVTDFTNFVNSVNTGNNYSGTTVYLGTDITLTGNIDPIGINYTYHFLGAFDGQGHAISSLTINSSSSNYAGLFSYSTGLTIRNVVLDDSCSITSTFTGNANANVGGIIGYYYATSSECNIENSVNMASVSFNGNTTGNYGDLSIGGIAGRLYSTSYNVYMKNCVNYGSVTDLGTVSNWVYLGGIVGESDRSSSSYICYIQNCLNYGKITYVGTSNSLYDGGIAGYSYGAYIENCVSAGKIATPTTATYGNYIGSIAGSVDSSFTYINYCYYTSDVGLSSLYGAGTPSRTTGTPTPTTSVDSELVSKLNSNATSCNWNKWLLNTNNATVTFKASDDKKISFSSQIILIPNPVKEGNSFLFWCKDAECIEEFDPEIDLVSGITDLYAAWTNNTVTFDFDNGTTVSVTFTYNTPIEYLDDIPKKEGYTLSWGNYHELMPAEDITVTAQWTPNNYTVTFDTNGGNVSETSKIVTFNEKYGNLPESPKKEGYIFLGWFTSEINGTEVTNETIVTVPHNHTLYAHWEEVTTQVEIVFSTKDLTQEEVKNIIKQYTNAKFTIEKFENESGEIRVVIGFVGKKEAEEFVDEITKGSSEASLIKRIDLVIDDTGSFSTTTYPFTLVTFITFLNVLFL